MSSFWDIPAQVHVHRPSRNLHKFVNFLFVFSCEVGNLDSLLPRHSFIMKTVHIRIPSLLNITL